MTTDPSDPLAPNPDGLNEPTRGSNPSSAGELGLSGDLGISSERTGPGGHDPRSFGVAGTGSKGGAVGRTDGGKDTSPTSFDAPDVSQSDVNPMHDDADTMTGAGNTPTGQESDRDIDRTVGEPSPNPIPDEKNRR